MVSHWQSNKDSSSGNGLVRDRQSSGVGLVFKWYGIDSQVVSHWQSNDQSQVVTDWSSSGIGLTVKWCHIGILMMKVKWQRIGLQVVWDRQPSGVTLVPPTYLLSEVTKLSSHLTPGR